MANKTSKQPRFQQVEIGKLEGRRCVLEAIPETMTAFGGVAMIAQIEKSSGLIEELSKRVIDKRSPNRLEHKGREIILQRVCQIATGNPDGNDADWMRGDPAILWALGRDPVSGQSGASQETISRFESNAASSENMSAIKSLFIDHFISQHTKHQTRWQRYWRRGKRRRITLDIDGSMIKTYGAQEGAIYRGGKYKHEMYYPSFIFAGNWLLAASLRPGCDGESTTVIEQLELVVPRLRRQWPGIAVKVRLDAAFGSPALYAWCRKNHVDYEVGLKETSVLNLYSKAYKQMAEEQFTEEFGAPLYTGKNGNEKSQEEHERIRRIEDPDERMKAEKARSARRVRVIGEFFYRSEKWKDWERIIVRVDYTDKGLDTRYVLVGRHSGLASNIYQDDYCGRGLMEQFIGQFKQTGHKLSAQSFNANQFRTTLYGVTYQQMVHLREALNGTTEHVEIDTVRKTLMVMPMVVRETKHKVVLQISESHPHARQFLAAWRKLIA